MLVVSNGHKRILLALFPTAYNGGCIEFFTGAAPESPNLAPTGTRVARLTNFGLPWVAGFPTNGLQYVLDPDTGQISPDPSQAWVIKGLATGVAGYGRMIGMNDTGVTSITEPRVDFDINPVDGSGFQMTDASFTAATSRDSTFFTFALPPIV